MMRTRQNASHGSRTPLFFKLWFAFIALLVATIFGGVLYVMVLAISHGPEGIGREVGLFLRGIEEGQR
mgnify:CR=1 FL=1